MKFNWFWWETTAVYAYPNNKERIRSVCISLNNAHINLIQDSYNGSCGRKRYLQTSLMLEKLHLQVVSHRLYLIGTTIDYRCCCSIIWYRLLLFFISSPNNVFQNARCFYRWLVSQHTAKWLQSKPYCNLAPPCNLLSTSQMGSCLPKQYAKWGSKP